MNTSKHSDRQSITEQVYNMPVVIDFGIRAISSLRFSKMIALPKIALAHCSGLDVKRASVKLVLSNSEKYIRVEPLTTDQPEESKN